MTQIEDGYYGASVAFTNSSGIPSNQNFNGLRINKAAPKLIFSNQVLSKITAVTLHTIKSW